MKSRFGGILSFFCFKRAKTGKKSPVYVFFADAGSDEKKMVYKRAIANAEKDQKDLIAKYDREFAGTPS